MRSSILKRIFNPGGHLNFAHLVCCALLFSVALAAFSAAIFANPARADIYVLRDARGSITFTNRQLSKAKRFVPVKGSFSRVIISHGPHIEDNSRRVWQAHPSAYDSIIDRLASEHGIDPALVKAVVHAESAFRPNAVSRKGAMGLMQLMPGTARRFGVANAFHPEANMKGGTQYLRVLLDRYQGNVALAVAAYNAGEGAVDDYGNIPPYSETRSYVKRVLRLREVYRCHQQGKKSC